MDSLDEDLAKMQLELGDSYNLSNISLLKADSCRDI